MKRYIKSKREVNIEQSKRTDIDKSAIEIMLNNEDIQDDPLVGIFWYDIDNNELFGVKSTIASKLDWYHSQEWAI